MRKWFGWLINAGLLLVVVRQQWQQQKRASHNRSKANNNPRLSKGDYPTKQEHWTNEQTYWDRRIEAQDRPNWVGVFTLFAAGIAAAGGLGSYFEGRYQAKIAKDAYLASTRPWMLILNEIDNVSAGWMFNDVLTVQATWSIKNIGASPALQVIIWGQPMLNATFLKDDAYNNRVKNTCSRQENPASGVITIFPMEAVTRGSGSGIPTKKQSTDGVGQGVNVTYIACVSYRIPGDDAWHHTGKEFTLLKPERRSFVYGEPVVTGAITTEDHTGSYAD